MSRAYLHVWGISAETCHVAVVEWRKREKYYNERRRRTSQSNAVEIVNF